MTCTSDRSGIASSGVRSSDHTPHARRASVASSTRKRLAIDQRMSARDHGVRLRGRQARQRGFEAGLRIDQELTGQNDLLSRFEPRPNRRSAARFRAQRDCGDIESAALARDDHDAALARQDHGFARHHQVFLVALTFEIERHEHAGRELGSALSTTTRTGSVRVWGSTSGSNAATRPLNAMPGHAAACAVACDPSGIIETCALGHLGIDPDRLQAVDAKERGAGHEGRRLRALPALSRRRRSARRALRSHSSCGRASRSRIVLSGMPSTARRCRAASRIELSARRTAHRAAPDIPPAPRAMPARRYPRAAVRVVHARAARSRAGA